MARYIDADALKHEMEKLYEHHLEMRNYYADGAVADCIEFLDNAPTIDAAPQWISVKELLPEEDDNTEAWYESSDGFRARTVIVYNGRSVFPANRFRTSTGEPYEWSISAKNATHWMPLPEPPRENADAEEA